MQGEQHAVGGKYVSHHQCLSAGQRTEQPWAYRDTGMKEMDGATAVDCDTGVTGMDGATGSIYSGDSEVDRPSSHISSCIILSFDESHTQSFPTFDLTWSFRDFMDPHGKVVSYLLTLFLCYSSQNCSLSLIPFGMPREVQRRCDDGISDV